MWQILFFGSRPFRLENGQLQLAFTPFVPDYLMPEDGIVEATFLGKIPVTYRAAGLSALVPGQTVPVQYILTMTDGTKKTVAASVLDRTDAGSVRAGQVAAIEVTMA